MWGEEFENLYEQYERDGKARKTIKAQKLWFAIIDSQIETSLCTRMLVIGRTTNLFHLLLSGGGGGGGGYCGEEVQNF